MIDKKVQEIIIEPEEGSYWGSNISLDNAVKILILLARLSIDRKKDDGPASDLYQKLSSFFLSSFNENDKHKVQYLVGNYGIIEDIWINFGTKS